MPTMTARYGHSGLDDSQQLTSIAALMAADPRLKPTTAIRSLGVEDPVVIRRLRNKFRAEEPRLMAQARRARRATRSDRTRIIRANGKHKAAILPLQRPEAARAPEPETTPAPTRTETRPAGTPPWQVSSTAIFNAWCDIGFLVARAAVEKQSALMQQVLSLPQVSMTLRSQLALNSVAVAVFERSTCRTRRLSKLH